MGSDVKITGRVLAAGRVLAGIGREDFASVAGMSVKKIEVLESSGSAKLPTKDDIKAVMSALEHFGVIIIVEDENMGAGVRLKFSRKDVGQIMRLEGEGGMVRSDDAP